MRLTAITFPWADGEYTFDLRLGEVRKLQERTGFGPAVIAQRLENGLWNVDDYREVIMQGLLGGGMAAADAVKLVRNWVDDRPAKESLIPAKVILMAFIVGAPASKKKKTPKTAETTTGPGASTSKPSTEQAAPSVSVPAT